MTTPDSHIRELARQEVNIAFVFTMLVLLISGIIIIQGYRREIVTLQHRIEALEAQQQR